MLPIIEVPEPMRNSMAHYRDVFCREEGFDHVSRYVTGLILSSHKTLQGIDDLQVWDGELPSRRAMHEAVFEARWHTEQLMARHRHVVAREYRGQGRQVSSVDWTFAHHDRGPKI